MYQPLITGTSKEMLGEQEESHKLFTCFYGGSVPVSEAFGVEQVNRGIEIALNSRPLTQWPPVEVCVAPSSIRIKTENGSSTECRIRFVSFFAVCRNDTRLCGFIQKTAVGSFRCHILKCEPNAGGLCATIQAACELRYQQGVDSRMNFFPAVHKPRTERIIGSVICDDTLKGTAQPKSDGEK
ncbi:unnamed protein product [Calicophoron daubneyi]|uniref:PID domain-containing protein n=1 Tax=Calicophoron daubneyi TaxID=300641 RepID=A0AAV2T2D3_CALDB